MEGDGGTNWPLLSTASTQSAVDFGRGCQAIQLSWNSFGSSLLSFVPSDNEGLLEYGLFDAFTSRELGLAFSSETSAPLAGPLRDVKGIRNGGMANKCS